MVLGKFSHRYRDNEQTKKEEEGGGEEEAGNHELLGKNKRLEIIVYSLA